jgi:hypothetical protein
MTLHACPMINHAREPQKGAGGPKKKERRGKRPRGRFRDVKKVPCGYLLHVSCIGVPTQQSGPRAPWFSLARTILGIKKAKLWSWGVFFFFEVFPN